MKSAPKVHVAINHERSLCGMSPYQGNHDIRTFGTFSQVEESDQCLRCLTHLIERGYSIKKLRADAKLMPRKDVVVDRIKVMCSQTVEVCPGHIVHRLSDVARVRS